MLDFIISAIYRIRGWWVHDNSRTHKFVKNSIISIGVAWAAAMSLSSLAGLALGFILAFKLQTMEWANHMNEQVAIYVFWTFIIVVGLGVYLGIRALVIDIVAKSKIGYKDTFRGTVSMDDRMTKVEKDICELKDMVNHIIHKVNK